MKNQLFAFIVLGFSYAVFGQGHGIISYPLAVQQSYVSAEFTGVLSNGRGVGLQARYLHRFNQQLTFNGGFGFSDGKRANQMFAGVDYEVYPDYENQPRFALRTFLERSEEFNHGHTKMGLTPVVSKGFSFWGEEGFPFVSLPLTLDLDSDDKRYAITSQLALGASFPMPVVESSRLLANVEIALNIENSYSGFFVGFSHPLN